MPSETSPDSAPLLSIVLPAYNEEALLEESVEGLLDCLDGRFEVVISENGSTDGTLRITEDLASRYHEVKVCTLPQASYGRALQEGMAEARGEAVVVFNVDFWDLPFLRTAVPMLGWCDVIVGSKALATSNDRRPWSRRAITRIFNLGLSLLFGFRGTDTHGLKVFRRSALERALPRCRTDGEIFDTELILRCQKAGMTIQELPVQVSEMRPSRYGLVGRIPSTARDLVNLFLTLH